MLSTSLFHSSRRDVQECHHEHEPKVLVLDEMSSANVPLLPDGVEHIASDSERPFVEVLVVSPA